MYSEILQKLGLSTNEAKVYELLLLNGESKASDLVKGSGLGRGNVYNLLTSLVARGLVTVSAGKQQKYKSADPSALNKLVDERRRELARLEVEFKEELPKLASTFNLTTGRPAIEVFEGLDGAREAVFDSLNSKTEILTYYDFESVQGILERIDEEYYKAYVKKDLQKRIIVVDSEKAHSYFKEPLFNTHISFIPHFPQKFHSAVQVYDNTVSFITLKGERLISVIIRDPAIYEFMAQLFYFHLRHAEHELMPAGNSDHSQEHTGAAEGLQDQP